MRAEPIADLWDRVKALDRKNTVKMLVARMQTRFVRSFSETNIGDLIRGTAKSEAPETKNQIRVVLKEWLSESESVEQGRSESAEPGVAKFGDRADDQTVEQWKHRAILAEDRLEQLQNNIRAALSLSTAPPVPLSSAPDLSEAQAIAKRAGDAHGAHPQK